MYESPEMIYIPSNANELDKDRGCPYNGFYCNPPEAFFALCAQTSAYNPICMATEIHCVQLNVYSN